MVKTLALCLLLHIVYCRQTMQDSLLFTVTPGDQQSGAGLYGALVSDTAGKLIVAAEYEFKFGYHCFHENEHVQPEYHLQSVAYDDVTGYVLLHKHGQINRDHITIHEGHACHNMGGCSLRSAPRVIFDRANFLYKKPKVFAYHDRVIYFLSQQVRDEDGYRHNVIEFRRFVGCNELYPVTSGTRFIIDQCSELLATLINEQARQIGHDPLGLRIFSIDGQMTAFITLQETIYSREREMINLVIKLYSVQFDANGNQFKLLHSEDIGQAGYRHYIMQQLGQIDYRDDKLCWSAIDRVICADLFTPRGNISRPRYIVNPGAASFTVCRGDEKFTNITSGVAIAEVDNDEISLFFGCIAGVSGIGGSGFVRMQHWDFDHMPRLRQIKNTTSSLYSGQMFITDKCKYIKPTRLPIEADSESEKDTRVVPSTQSGCRLNPTLYAIQASLIALLLTIS